MMESGKHIVEKLVIEVNVPHIGEGYRIRDNVGAFVDRYVVPALERYIGMFPPDRIIRIERLQLELEAPSSNFEELMKGSVTLEMELEQAFEKALKQDIPIGMNMQPEDTAPILEILEPAAHQTEAFLHFLEKGTRPWWIGSSKELDALLSGTLFRKWKAEEQMVLEKAVKAVMQKTAVKRRLVRQFTDESLIRILRVAAYVPEKALPERQLRAFLRLLEKEANIPATVVTRERVWELLMAVLPGVPGRRAVSPEALSAEFVRTMLYGKPQPSAPKLLALVKSFLRLVTVFSGETVTDAQLQSVAEAFVAEMFAGKAFVAETFSGGRSPEDLPAGENVPVNDDRAQPKAPGKNDEETVRNTMPEGNRAEMQREAEREKQPDTRSGLPEEALYVDNAGLVLVHPFLKHLFLNTGQLEGDRLIDPVLAVHMLHYLATGSEEGFEHAMLFEKYLVGIPPEESIPRLVPLGNAVKEEIAALLQAVRENWQPMGGSSDAAIRETFLQRPGKLIPEMPQPRLVMERKTVDILMDKLNWSVSIVRFPWKKDILYVEW